MQSHSSSTVHLSFTKTKHKHFWWSVFDCSVYMKIGRYLMRSGPPSNIDIFIDAIHKSHDGHFKINIRLGWQARGKWHLCIALEQFQKCWCWCAVSVLSKHASVIFWPEIMLLEQLLQDHLLLDHESSGVIF